jgi:hypothetical protein
MIHTLTVALILSTAGAAVPIAAGMNAAALPAELSAEALGRYLSHRSPLQQKTTEYGYSDSLVRSLKSITERSWRGRCSGMLGARDASSRVPLIGICDLVTSLSARRHGFRQDLGTMVLSTRSVRRTIAVVRRKTRLYRLIQSIISMLS